VKNAPEKLTNSLKKKNKLVETEERNDLATVAFQIWPNLTKYADRLFSYYVGPTNIIWPEFDLTRDSVFINTVNKKVADGKDIIFLCNPSEVMRETTLHKIHRCLSKLSVSPSQLYLTTGALNGPELYEEFCQRNNLVDRINILPCNIFLRVTNQLKECEVEPYTIKIRSRNFLCFNRVERRHRIVLLAKLISENLLENSFYSFYGNHFNNEWINENQLRNYSKLSDDMIDILMENKHLLPMHLTGDEHTRNNPIQLIEDDAKLFSESYYSVVTETLFYNDAYLDNLNFGNIPAIFFTEKIYKPICMNHPFLLVSMPNSLKYLRSLGFKTFSPFINESYDTETDDDLRMQMIVAEIKRLDTFTDEQWIDWQKNVKEIVEYNLQTFNSIDTYYYGKDINF